MSVENINYVENFDRNISPIEHTKGTGFTDWKRAAMQLNDRSLDILLGSLDVSDTAEKSARRFITERIELLDLPTQAYMFVPASELLQSPETYFHQIPDGDYYFASIRPGFHLAHAETVEEVVAFVEHYLRQSSTDEGQREVFIAHNGEALMSGHIVIKNDDDQNSIYAEFTNRNFNAFHRGFTNPEIILRRPPSGNGIFEWTFTGALEPTEGEDWRDETLYECFGGTSLSRIDMASHIINAVMAIPHDNKRFLPGYYEVLFERTKNGIRPAFIEALPYVQP